jgi:hypothetical protein
MSLYIVKNGSVVVLGPTGERVTKKVGDELELSKEQAEKMDPTGHYLELKKAEKKSDSK